VAPDPLELGTADSGSSVEDAHHVRVTDDIAKLAASMVGEETNPAKPARLLLDHTIASADRGPERWFAGLTEWRLWLLQGGELRFEGTAQKEPVDTTIRAHAHIRRANRACAWSTRSVRSSHVWVRERSMSSSMGAGVTAPLPHPRSQSTYVVL